MRVFSRGRAGVRFNRCLCFFAYLPNLVEANQNTGNKVTVIVFTRAEALMKLADKLPD